MIDTHIRIKPYFSIIAHSSDFIELRAGVWNHVSYTVQDDSASGILYKFISALNGAMSVADIAKSLNMARSEAEGIIDHLKQLDVIEHSASTALDYYTDTYTPAFKNKQVDKNEACNKKIYVISESKIAEEIRDTVLGKTPLINVEIINFNHELFKILNNVDQSWLHNALLFEEIIEKFSSLKDSIVVLALEHINPIFTKKFNRIATALDIVWIHAAIDGPFIFIGPTFEPYKTACYECFETRVSMNLREFNSYQRYKSAIVENTIHRKSEFPMQKLLASLMINHLVMEIMNYALTSCCFTKNKVLSIYLPTMEITFNEFLKVSTCHNCGSMPHRDDSQLYFDIQGLLKEEQ